MATMKNDEGYDEGNDVYKITPQGKETFRKLRKKNPEVMREEWVDTADQNFEHFRGSLLLDTKKLFINLKNQSPAVACPQKEIVLYKARRTQLTLPFVSRKGATSVGVNINPTLSGKKSFCKTRASMALSLHCFFNLFALPYACNME